MLQSFKSSLVANDLKYKGRTERHSASDLKTPDEEVDDLLQVFKLFSDEDDSWLEKSKNKHANSRQYQIDYLSGFGNDLSGVTRDE